MDKNTPYGTVLTDLVCNASITEVISCFDNHSILKEMLAGCESIKYIYKRGEANGLCHMETKFPWPLKNRDMAFHYSGVADHINHAIITISKSLQPNFNYFGVKVPEASKGCERMDFKYLYNFFQYLGPNKTRYI